MYLVFHDSQNLCIYEVRECYDFTCTRNMSQLIKQIRRGWTGGTWQDEALGTRTVRPVDAVLCKKYLDHAMEELNKWVLKSGPEGSKYRPRGYSGIRSNFTLLNCILRFIERSGVVKNMVLSQILLMASERNLLKIKYIQQQS